MNLSIVLPSTCTALSFRSCDIALGFSAVRTCVRRGNVRVWPALLNSGELGEWLFNKENTRRREGGVAPEVRVQILVS